MRYTEEHHVAGRPDDVWRALHDPEVLSASIPGCERLIPLGDQEYVAILTAGTDTYRGLLTVTDIAPGSRLTVSLDGRGRHHTLEVGLEVRVGHGPASGTTSLAYDARVHVGGPAGATDHLMRSCSRAVLMTAESVARSKAP
jgi:carbon monoxide dehydrogenase subunit G